MGFIAAVGWCLPTIKLLLIPVEEMVQSAVFFAEIMEMHIADVAQIGRIFALSVRFAMCFHST